MTLKYNYKNHSEIPTSVSDLVQQASQTPVKDLELQVINDFLNSWELWIDDQDREWWRSKKC